MCYRISLELVPSAANNIMNIQNRRPEQHPQSPRHNQKVVVSELPPCCKLKVKAVNLMHLSMSKVMHLSMSSPYLKWGGRAGASGNLREFDCDVIPRVGSVVGHHAFN